MAENIILNYGDEAISIVNNNYITGILKLIVFLWKIRTYF
jgi:hypothetical protein